MTEQEILDCNKAIAEFMGIKSTWIYCFVCDSMYQEAGCAYAACGSKTEERNRHMDYQDNWSELMPVVEKIKDTVLSFDIYMQGAYTKVICFEKPDNPILKITSKEKPPVEVVWLAVIEFIKWYKQKN